MLEVLHIWKYPQCKCTSYMIWLYIQKSITQRLAPYSGYFLRGKIFCGTTIFCIPKKFCRLNFHGSKFSKLIYWHSRIPLNCKKCENYTPVKNIRYRNITDIRVPNILTSYLISNWIRGRSGNEAIWSPITGLSDCTITSVTKYGDC